MRLLLTFLHRYPLQSAIALGALLFAGLIEGFGLSLMVPRHPEKGNETRLSRYAPAAAE